MSGKSSFFTRRSTRWSLHCATALLGAGGIWCLASFVFGELQPAIERGEAPTRFGSVIAGFILLAATIVASALAFTSSMMAHVGRTHVERTETNQQESAS